MINIYSPQSPLEAETLHNMLTSHHIHSHVEGVIFLPTVDGKLPAFDSMALSTDIADAQRALELIDSFPTA